MSRPHDVVADSWLGQSKDQTPVPIQPAACPHTIITLSTPFYLQWWGAQWGFVQGWLFHRVVSLHDFFFSPAGDAPVKQAENE